MIIMSNLDKKFAEIQNAKLKNFVDEIYKDVSKLLINKEIRKHTSSKGLDNSESVNDESGCELNVEDKTNEITIDSETFAKKDCDGDSQKIIEPMPNNYDQGKSVTGNTSFKIITEDLNGIHKKIQSLQKQIDDIVTKNDKESCCCNNTEKKSTNTSNDSVSKLLENDTKNNSNFMIFQGTVWCNRSSNILQILENDVFAIVPYNLNITRTEIIGALLVEFVDSINEDLYNDIDWCWITDFKLKNCCKNTKIQRIIYDFNLLNTTNPVYVNDTNLRKTTSRKSGF